MTARILILLALLSGTGCALLPAPHNPVPDAPHDMSQRLAQLSQWSLTGKIGVRAGKEGGSAYLDWQQLNDIFTLTLSGPLGQGTTKIQGDASQTQLTTHKNQVYTANSPEALLYQHTGWQLPIQPLRYWVKGIPAPELAAKIERDANGTIIQLTQGQWQLSFANHTLVNGYWLPQKIKIWTVADIQPPLKITLAIKRWTL